MKYKKILLMALLLGTTLPNVINNSKIVLSKRDALQDVRNIRNPITITPTDTSPKLENITIDSLHENENIMIGEVYDLTIIYYPSTAKLLNLKWMVDNESIATIRDTKIIPLIKGRVKLTATSGSISTSINLNIIEDKSANY